MNIILSKRLIWTLVLLLVVVSGCTEQSQLLPEAIQDSPSPEGIATTTPSTVPLPSVVWQREVATFIDPVLGVALDVPSDWQINPRLGPPAASAPSTFGSNIPRRSLIELRPSGTQIQIVPWLSPVNSFDELKVSAMLTDTTILDERQFDLHGLPALWVETEIEETDTGLKFPIIQVFILVDENSIRLTAYGDLSPVESVVSSIRSAQSELETANLVTPAVPLPSVVWQEKTATFTDFALGFALDVPSDWHIYPRLELPPNPRGSIFATPCLNGAPIVLPPCTLIRVNSTTFLSLDDVEQYFAEKDTVVVVEQQLDINGLSALWIETERGNDTLLQNSVISVYVLIDERIIRLSTYGELSPVADIVNSLRPIE